MLPGEPHASDPLREFGLGAQVLADLGLHKIRLLTNNPRKIAGIHGYGLDVVESVSLASVSSPSFGPLTGYAGDGLSKETK